ncbi:hypothetical protein ZWY2020_001168 [Hordeum vulgare]|nr:hypothetical protein ZWY2020_001168 [Hordeum vulgare]
MVVDQPEQRHASPAAVYTPLARPSQRRRSRRTAPTTWPPARARCTCAGAASATRSGSSCRPGSPRCSRPSSGPPRSPAPRAACSPPRTTPWHSPSCPPATDIARATEWRLQWDLRLVTLVYSGGVHHGRHVRARVVDSWAVARRCPVCPTMFNSLSLPRWWPATTAVDAVVLVTDLYLSGVLGTALVVVGLYVFLWV